MDNTGYTVNRGDMIDTPYGPGVVLKGGTFPDSILVSVNGTDYRIKYVGRIIGHIELPPEE